MLEKGVAQIREHEGSLAVALQNAATANAEADDARKGRGADSGARGLAGGGAAERGDGERGGGRCSKRAWRRFGSTRARWRWRCRTRRRRTRRRTMLEKGVAQIREHEGSLAVALQNAATANAEADDARKGRGADSGARGFAGGGAAERGDGERG